ncbi:MAG TPA: hypothetical protein VHO06_25375, partial [Polyangia bacterium]|nr:hypothetical protein [Polyangia bacterium]
MRRSYGLGLAVLPVLATGAPACNDTVPSQQPTFDGGAGSGGGAAGGAATGGTGGGPGTGGAP